MILRSIRYSQKEGTDKEWRFSTESLGEIVLIVGRNATGKSRILSVIYNMAAFLSGKKSVNLLGSGHWKASFESGHDTLVYELKLELTAVVYEELIKNGEVLLKRSGSSSGEIFNCMTSKLTPFQCPDNQIAAISRRDTLQHPFLEEIYKWASELRSYNFGQAMGHHTFSLSSSEMTDQKITDPDDWEDVAQQKVLRVFQRGLKANSSFGDTVAADMKMVGFPVESVSPGVEDEIIANAGPLNNICVRETGLKCATSQLAMSAGMWRTLSVIIQLNYRISTNSDGLILIDDIGEGLDYERSTALIKLIISKSKDTGTQLIMSTNDRFVMNEVPLDYWAVAVRTGGVVEIFNSKNKREEFDDFKFAGLSNFEFFKNISFGTEASRRD